MLFTSQINNIISTDDQIEDSEGLRTEMRDNVRDLIAAYESGLQDRSVDHVSHVPQAQLRADAYAIADEYAEAEEEWYEQPDVEDEEVDSDFERLTEIQLHQLRCRVPNCRDCKSVQVGEGDGKQKGKQSEKKKKNKKRNKKNKGKQ